jgi:hypothetical protein
MICEWEWCWEIQRVIYLVNLYVEHTHTHTQLKKKERETKKKTTTCNAQTLTSLKATHVGVCLYLVEVSKRRDEAISGVSENGHNSHMLGRISQHTLGEIGHAIQLLK